MAFGFPLACLALLLTAGPARADLIVDRPLDPASAGGFSNLGPANEQKANDFEVATLTTLDTISWSGRYGGAVSVADPVAFSIRFFVNDVDRPAVSPLRVYDVTVEAEDTGLTFGSIPWFSYSASLSGLALGAGTYWVSILESDPRTAAVGQTQWLWGHSTTRGVEAFRSRDGDAWERRAGLPNFAFGLSGIPVAEPSGVLLFGVGSSVILALRWRGVVARTAER